MIDRRVRLAPLAERTLFLSTSPLAVPIIESRLLEEMRRFMPRRHVPRMIVSGGQTGVDRAALDVAIALRLDHGGHCPRGRKAEDGPIPAHYSLVETTSDRYPPRTELNVLHSDATLILHRGVISAGTALTQRLATAKQKPCLCVDVNDPQAEAQIREWLETHHPERLNVAGPRESSSPGIHAAAFGILKRVLEPTPK